jgi:hypothetical protein
MDPLDRDPLERDLRDLLTDERLALPTQWVRVDRVHAGATRRRRRRAAAVSVVGAVVVAAVAGSAFLAHPGRFGGQPANTSASADKQTDQQTEQPTGTPSGSSATSPLPAVVGPAWDGAHVLSMTATSAHTFVVLGAVRDADRCLPIECNRLAESHDGGRTFDALPLPATSAADATDPQSATDVRFGSAQDGWLFGAGLWASHDGGHDWTRLDLGGPVRRLEAAAGTVWALVGDGDHEQLWSSEVGSDDWSKVSGVSISGPGDLAVQGARVVVLGTGDQAWTNDSGTFKPSDNPCASSLAVRLSGSGSLWATCVTGTAAHLATSGDEGATWSDVTVDTGEGSLPNSVQLGARSTSEAIMAIPQQPLSRLSLTGKTTGVVTSPTGSGVDYLGFTTRYVGYAIVDGSTLWHTVDGAVNWTKVDITTP